MALKSAATNVFSCTVTYELLLIVHRHSFSSRICNLGSTTDWLLSPTSRLPSPGSISDRNNGLVVVCGTRTSLNELSNDACGLQTDTKTSVFDFQAVMLTPFNFSQDIRHVYLAT